MDRERNNKEPNRADLFTKMWADQGKVTAS